MCQILHWCAISGCIFLLWGRFWRICWGHQSFAHVSSTFRHRPGHLRLSADKPADASAMCGFFGRIFLVRQFQHPSTLQRQTSSENMSNHRRCGFIELLCGDQWDNHLAFNVFSKLDQVSPAECRGWHSAKHGLYIAAGILAGNLDEMTRLFLSESRPHSCFQPNTKSRPELEQASHGQDKTDMHELSKLWNKQRQVSMCWRHPGLLAAELVGLPQDPAGLTATLNKDTFVCLSVCMFVCLY